MAKVNMWPVSTLRTWFSEEPTPWRMAVVLSMIFGLAAVMAAVTLVVV